MDKTLSQIILDLYEIRENPLQNIEKFYSILDKAQSLGIQVGPPEFPTREERASSRFIETRVSTLGSLLECVSKYLSSERQGYERPESTIHQLAETLQVNLRQSLDLYDNQLSSLQFKITESNREYFENLISQFIGRRLEHELLPNLMEKMGFEKQTTALKVDGKIMEIDGRYELNKYDGAANEILVEKSVIIVECKTTVGLRDIEKFHRKVSVLRQKYENDKVNWGYDRLNFECWIVGCYGWSEDLVKEVEAKGIKVFTSDRFEDLLKKNKAFDGRIPTCPPCK